MSEKRNDDLNIDELIPQESIPEYNMESPAMEYETSINKEKEVVAEPEDFVSEEDIQNQAVKAPVSQPNKNDVPTRSVRNEGAYVPADPTPEKKRATKRAGFVIAGILSFAVGLMVGLAPWETEKAEESITITKPAFNEDSNKEIVLPTVPNSNAVVYSVEEIVEANMPALVSIDTIHVYTENYFFFEQQYEAAGAGSGFIIRNENGEISVLTNAHVVEDTKNIKVTFVDGASVNAIIKSLDAKADLALLAINSDDINPDTLSQIKCVKLGNSDDLKLGQAVVAIGNSLGYGQTVTTGVVSALNREIIDESGNAHILIQTDAAINAGNSGGVLLDMNGCVIGINEAKIADAAVDDVGFAIPITDALETINLLSVIEPNFPVEESKRGKLNITAVEVDAMNSAAFGIPQGIMIKDVVKDGCADKAGLLENDVITKLNDTEIKTMNDVSNVLNYLEAGSEITIEYYRTSDGHWKKDVVTGILGTTQ